MLKFMLSLRKDTTRTWMLCLSSRNHSTGPSKQAAYGSKSSVANCWRWASRIAQATRVCLHITRNVALALLVATSTTLFVPTATRLYSNGSNLNSSRLTLTLQVFVRSIWDHLNGFYALPLIKRRTLPSPSLKQLTLRRCSTNLSPRTR